MFQRIEQIVKIRKRILAASADKGGSPISTHPLLPLLALRVGLSNDLSESYVILHQMLKPQQTHGASNKWQVVP